TSGKIAHGFIYNVVLTDAEILRLANGALPTEIRPESLVAYWPLIDNDKDIIGGYDMTPENSPTWSTTDYPNVWVPNKGKWEIQDILPATIDESGFQSDGAFHIMPVNPRQKPSTDNDDLKTAPDVDAVGGIFEDIELALLLNEGTGTPADSSGNSLSITNTADWIDGSDPDTGLDFVGGNNDYLEVAAGLRTALTNSDITIVMRIILDAKQDDRSLLTCYEGSPDYYGWGFAMDTAPDHLSFWSENSGSWVDSDAISYSTGEWMTVAIVLNNTSVTFYLNGVDVGGGTSARATTAASVLPRIFNNEADGTFTDGKCAFCYVWSRALSTAEIRFITNNPYYPFGESIRSKYTLDRTRIRPNTVIPDWPFQYGPVANPTDIVLNKLKMDDNAADNILKAEIGPDGSWHNLAGTDRNTNSSGDSVQIDNFRGRALDNQDATAYAELAVGSGTPHDNAFFKKGSALLKLTPQFDYDVSNWQALFNLYQATDTDVLVFTYSWEDDRWELDTYWGGTQTTLNGPAYISNAELKRPHVILLSWDSDKDFLMFAVDGQVIAVGSNTATPTSSGFSHRSRLRPARRH
ncbi:MAG: LamG domain-containing protein, partial [Planctomycetota bacterium]